jgi:hypothetical protein
VVVESASEVSGGVSPSISPGRFSSGFSSGSVCPSGGVASGGVASGGGKPSLPGPPILASLAPGAFFSGLLTLVCFPELQAGKSSPQMMKALNIFKHCFMGELSLERLLGLFGIVRNLRKYKVLPSVEAQKVPS